MNPPDRIARYCDRKGVLVQWPAAKQKTARVAVLEWLAEHFEPNRDYTEREVNDILNRLHAFSDPALLRREMFDAGLIQRSRDVRRYWREAPSL